MRDARAIVTDLDHSVAAISTAGDIYAAILLGKGFDGVGEDVGSTLLTSVGLPKMYPPGSRVT